jgi:phosphoglycerol transferase
MHDSSELDTVRPRVEDPPDPHHRFPTLSPQLALFQASLILATMWVFLRGWRRDFTVPFGFTLDSLFYLMQAKSTVDNGWWWFNPMVGAPLGLDERAFPANGNVDQAIVWLASRLLSDPLAAINLSWLLMVAMSGVAATWCMRTLGISRTAAFVAGTLFAVSPYALYKNLGHFGMAIYLIPFPCAIVLQLASNRLPAGGLWKWPGLGLLAGSGLLGFNYIYYPFFGCFFAAVATAIGFLTFRSKRILASGALALVVMGGCAFLNLAPSLYSWQRYGAPTILSDKVPAQAEIYALKIRSLVSPNYQHWFPPFRKWVEKEEMSRYPVETENTFSRLGVVATAGFLGLLAVLLAPTVAARSETGRLWLGGGQLTVAGLLLATTGGFGALFSLLVTPDIRAYARICPFLAMFALVAIAAAMDAGRWSRRWTILIAASVLVIGLADQSTGAYRMNDEYPAAAAEMPALKAFVRGIEQALPEGAMVLQLPLRRTYLNEIGVYRIQQYEHLKLYLVSRRLRWSYPALSNEQVGWMESTARLTWQQLPEQMATEGFSAIVIDRFGYQDNGERVLAAIRAPLGGRGVLAETERFIALDIRPLSAGAARSRLSSRPGPMSPDLARCPGQTSMMIDRVGRMPSPFPQVIPVRGSRAVKVTGWGIDQPSGSTGRAIDVLVDGRPVPTFYGLDREDVSSTFGSMSYRESGFATEVAARTLAPGAHTLALRLIAANGECYYEGQPLNVVVR